MKLEHRAFQGELPALDVRLLPENNAQAARNVDLARGTLKPYYAPSSAVGVSAVANPSTLYRYPNGNDGAGFWLTWGLDKQVHVVKSPLANDAYSRVYWTGDGAPKMGGISDITAGTPPYPGSSYRLGVPMPDEPVAAEPSGRGEAPDTSVDTAYVMTLVSGFGEESAPSLPSATVMRWDEGGDIELSLPAIPSGSHDIQSKRLYRAESNGVYQFVAEVSASTGAYTDSVPSSNLGAALPSTEWDMPDDRMQGLTALPGGIMAGFFENTLCFSEAYLPHAWPVIYQQAFSDDIVAIGATSNGLVVATTGQPYIVSGSSPEAMAPMQLDANQPCIGARSFVDMGEFVLYAGYEGLVAVGGRDAQVVTKNVLTKEQWQALSPSSIHAYRYEGEYLAFYDGGCFVFTPGEGIRFLDVFADSGYYDIADGRLYLIQGSDIVVWNEGADLTYRWRSRLHEVPPGAAGFTCAKVIAYGYPVTLRLFADGEQVISQQVQGPGMIRLPAGYTLSRDWEIELEGTHELNSVQIATSPAELI